MIAVIFEVTMKEGEAERYFELGRSLRAEVEKHDGFLSIERFQSLSTPGKYLSISYWRDEASVEAWHGNLRHRAAQNLGKSEIFADYRITVANALRSYSMGEERPAPTTPR
jgi:heme-degrading monooxygenase HmoA